MTRTILINAVNVRSPGAVSLARSLLEVFSKSDRGYRFVVVAHSDSPLLTDSISGERIGYFTLTRGKLPRPLARLWEEFRVVPAIVHRIKPEAMLSLGNLAPISTGVPTIVLMQNPVIADPSLSASAAGLSSLNVAANRYLFRRTASRVDAVIVQTAYMGRLVNKHYGLDEDRVHVVTNNVSPALLGAIVEEHRQSARFPKDGRPLRLIYPAAPYPYKNFDLILKIATSMKTESPSPVQFVVTVDESTKAGRRFKRQVTGAGLGDLIQNSGMVGQRQLSAEYLKSSALFFPSLAESFGNPLVESAYFGLPVLVSDLPYARDLAGESAIYFDPRNVGSAIAAIQRIQTESAWSDYAARSLERYRTTPTWEKIGDRIVSIVESTIQR